MDYGKKAYMRAEELERRLDMLSAPKKENACSVSAFDGREIKAGREYKFGVLRGESECAVIVKISAEVYDCGTVRLSMNGLNIACAEFPFLGKDEKIILASVRAGSPAALSLNCENGFFGLVSKVEAVALGENVSLSSFSGGAGSAENGNKTGVAYCSGGLLRFAVFDTFSGEKESEEAICGGTDAAIAASGDGFAIVYRDCFGGLWGTVAGETTYLGVSGDAVAAESFGDGFAVAYVKGGKVYILYTRSGFSEFAGESGIYFPYAAESVALCSGAGKLILIIGSGGKLFMKEAVSGVGGKFGVNANITVEIN